MTTKNYGAGTSGYLDPEGRAWETTVIQASKPILDKELNLFQDAEQAAMSTLSRRSFPSGWLSDNFLNSSLTDVVDPSSPVADTLKSPGHWAAVNGWTVKVSNTGLNTGLNALSLGAGPAGAGSKRTDLVFLEVWRRLISASPSSAGKSPGGRIWRDGNVKIASGDDVSLNYLDDILDGAVGTETSKRVQIQYRLRVHQGVDIYTYPEGLTDPVAVARTVPASAAAPDGTASAFTYTNQSANGDSGLWRAGDGNPANSLGTVDGYMYAIPLLAVFRRNTAVFARNTNHNGGVASPGPSDRPDGLFYDIIQTNDVLDLRQGVSPSGWDAQEVLEKNLAFLFENLNQTEIGTTTNGGGVDGHTVLWADEIGVSNANGGDGTTTGDTPGATFIGQFDAVRRTYSDRPVYEIVTLKYLPNDPGVSPGGANWTVGTTITISPSALPIWPYASFNWASFAPSAISVNDVLKTWFSSSTAGKKTFIANSNFRISGLASVPQGAIVARIESLTNGTDTATDEALYVSVLIAYPPGVGLSKTPTGQFSSIGSFNTGVFINNPAQLPVASPILYSALATPVYTPTNREIRLQYQTLSHTFSLRPGAAAGNNVFHMPERPLVVSGITINSVGYVGTITLGGAGSTVTITAGAVTGGEDVVITYTSIRALPNNGEQVTVYYEARLPQTYRDALLPNSLALNVRYVSGNMYCLSAGSGASGEAYPYAQAYVQAGAVNPSTSGSFGGDHELDGDLRVSTTTLFADTGFMRLPIHVPIAPSNGYGITRSPGDTDAEGRTFYTGVNNSYYMTAVGPTLSDPKRHKNLVPILCELPADSTLGRKGQLVLMVISRWADFDDSNSVGFTSSLATNTTAASIYRLKGSLLSNRRV